MENKIVLTDEQVQRLNEGMKSRAVTDILTTAFSLLFCVIVVVCATFLAWHFNNSSFVWLYLMAFICYLAG